MWKVKSLFLFYIFWCSKKGSKEVQTLLGMHVSFTAPLNWNNGPDSALVEITVD